MRSKFYAGLDAGIGLLDLSRNNAAANRNSPFALGFYGGFMPLKWLRTGISLNGWLFEPYSNFDLSKGVSISNSYLQIQAFPFKKSNLYLNFAGGISNYITSHPGEDRAKGKGALAGLGYETRVSESVGISFTINYGFGQFENVNYTSVSIKNQHYNVIEFLIGISYHFNPGRCSRIK